MEVNAYICDSRVEGDRLSGRMFTSGRLPGIATKGKGNIWVGKLMELKVPRKRITVTGCG